jgi:hypothetical protein
MSFGKWKLRQFVKPQLIIGSKRLNSIGDQLSINDNNGIQGLIVLNMEPKKIMTLQTQAYAPWNLWGLNPTLTILLHCLEPCPWTICK